eukprot:6997990-Lingulodinium_polyedra.AAC.1
MKEALYSRYGEIISFARVAASWSPRRAAVTLTRYQVGQDGRSARARWQGRRCKKEVAEFGERLCVPTMGCPGGRNVAR